MNKKQNEIGKNLSSGAEKTENIAELAEERASAATSEAKSAKKPVKKPAASAVKREKAAAKKRVDVALLKEERKTKRAEAKAARVEKRAEQKALRKAKREEKKLALKEKRMEYLAAQKERAAAAKEKRAERKAQRLARRELLKSETAAERRSRLEKERAEKAALRKQKQEQAYNLKLEKRDARLKKREQKLKDRQHKRETRRTPGFGGWLAAVISLGSVCLALTAVVTYGAIEMRRTGSATLSGYRSTLYEVVEIMDGVDADLVKMRASASPTRQEQLLTDLLVQARLAEGSLERFPVEGQKEENLTSFLNRTAATAERLLGKLRAGETLTAEDEAKLDEIYVANRAVREELTNLTASCSDKDFNCLLKDKKNKISEAFERMETITERKTRDPKRAVPSAGTERNVEEISASRAEELCLTYFQDYGAKKASYAGETLSRGLETYDFVLEDEKGVEIYAQLTKRGGELIGFEYYAPCTQKNFDLARSKAIAEEYLEKLGYEDMIPVWVDENGTTAEFLFTYEADGAAYYPDSVKVQVCEERGKVTAFDAAAYLRHHRARPDVTAKLSLGEAQAKLNRKLTVESSRLAVIPAHGGRETTAYEFLCTRDDAKYFVYLSAETGEELQIVAVTETDTGRYLR